MKKNGKNYVKKIHKSKKIKQFVQITKNNIEKYGKVLDLLGHSNLVIADSLDSPKLFFLDPDG